MTTTWQLDGIKSVDPVTMKIRIIEFIDGVEVNRYTKVFPKTAAVTQVLNQLALLVKQKRQAELDDRVPFNDIDLSNFETRVGNA